MIGNGDSVRSRSVGGEAIVARWAETPAQDLWRGGGDDWRHTDGGSDKHPQSRWCGGKSGGQDRVSSTRRIGEGPHRTPVRFCIATTPTTLFFVHYDAICAVTVPQL